MQQVILEAAGEFADVAKALLGVSWGHEWRTVDELSSRVGLPSIGIDAVASLSFYPTLLSIGFRYRSEVINIRRVFEAYREGVQVAVDGEEVDWDDLEMVVRASDFLIRVTNEDACAFISLENPSQPD